MSAAPPTTYHYHPKSRVPPSLEAVQKQLVAGGDAFPEEQQAEELAGKLRELGGRLRGPSPDLAGWLLAPDFKGARLTGDEVADGNSPQLEVFRAKTAPSAALTLDRAAFEKELRAMMGDFASLETAEFLITAIDTQPAAQVRQVRTTVRFDLAGTAKQGWRAERIGFWQLRWRRADSGAAAGDKDWRVVEWTTLDGGVRSRALAPVFTETTASAFGKNDSFRQQLVPSLDEWTTRLDGAFMPGGMGHHGVAVADVDGDGLDDIYVSQPSGLPNRLFHNNGDGTFADVTDAAGVGVLDSTSTSLFADVDNDGDEDLIVVTQTGPLLFLNDGKGHFTRDPDAFSFKQPLRGSLTSASMADFDRDGFLDLYLCAYSFFIGSSEDKGGPPTPYHDAQNGPPAILLRNDGHGKFVEVTADVGLNEHNDRFHFAAAWADYDEDGWPDLLVANDFGRKNLFHNDGAKGGRSLFKDVAGQAGAEDYGAGMSATFLDYDNDGHLDIYTGNMWTAAGQRITNEPGFKPDAPSDIREIYRRHARGNTLLRNKGDGTFEDVTLNAGAQFGRWAWSSDAFDFDNDGWQDLYIVNGMFTRDTPDRDDPTIDVDSFFWRQVVAQSPLTRQPGTPYDDGWRATNRLLVRNGTQAQHERNVLLRNNGHGGFDEVSGVSGLDIDQDGRSFAVFDYDGDGDADVVLMAARSSPQLRLFRNDFGVGGATGHNALTLRLIGKKSNRDAVGARVTVDTDTGLHATRLVTAGSGFLSEHSKQLLFGLGKSQRVDKVTITWPSGLVQTLSNVPINQRVTVEEGNDQFRAEPFRTPSTPGAASPNTTITTATSVPSETWLYQPFPAPDFTLRDVNGQEHSLSGMAGHAAVITFWASWASPSRAALDELSRQHAGTDILAIAVDPSEDATKIRAATQGLGFPVAVATEDFAGTYDIIYRYLFDRREDLPLPTTLLLNAQGEIVKVYRGSLAAAKIADDIAKLKPTATAPANATSANATSHERLMRAVPFRGTFYSTPGDRGYFQYGLELSEQGHDAPALVAFERVAKSEPSAITFYNLGTLYMKAAQPDGAKTALEHAIALDPGYAEANNTLGALLAQSGDAPGAAAHFRKALESKPDYADALNNFGYLLFQTGQRQEAFDLYQRALKAQPDFPEALNNVGIYYGQARDLEHAEQFFKQAVDKRPTYGEAANNLAIVYNAKGDTAGAIALLERLLKDNPAFEPAYVTLCRLYLASGQQQQGVQTLERLLQRNPTHPQGLQLLKQLQAGR